VQHELAAEAAADRGRHHVDVGLGDAQHVGDLFAHVERGLRRAVDGRSAGGRIGRHQDRVRLEVGLVHARRLVHRLRHRCRRGERGVDVSLRERHLAGDVRGRLLLAVVGADGGAVGGGFRGRSGHTVGPHQGCARRGRLVDRGRRRQRLVVDRGGLGAVLGGGDRLGHHQRDRLTREHDAIARQQHPMARRRHHVG
jgi:hypothetical protein